MTYQTELQVRKLLPDETLGDLARAIQNKAMMAYRGLPQSTLDNLMRMHFCQSLTDREMRHSVLRAKPASLSAALQYRTEKKSPSSRCRKNYS